MAEKDTSWMTIAMAARYACVSKETLWAACDLKQLAHVRVGGRRTIRLRREWIDGWLEQYFSGQRSLLSRREG